MSYFKAKFDFYWDLSLTPIAELKLLPQTPWLYLRGLFLRGCKG